MARFTEVLGNVAGGLGILVTLLAGVDRLIGRYWIMGMETGTMFEAGVALMVFACLVKVHRQAASG